MFACAERMFSGLDYTDGSFRRLKARDYWPGQERPERTTVPVPAASVLSGEQIQRSSSQSRARLTAFFQRAIRRSRSAASICGSNRLPSCHCPAISSVLCQ